MPELVAAPTLIPVPGGKMISEYVGRVSTGTAEVSIAHMVAPSGWTEPAQTPTFDEWTVVLRGAIQVEHDGGVLDVAAGQAVLARAGERVRYLAPGPDGAEYIAVCLPAFAPGLAHRSEP